MPLTSAEAALHEKPVSLPGVPDSSLERSSLYLTIAPSDHAAVSQAVAQANAIHDARALLPPAPLVKGYVLAELHDAQGNPPKGQLVWIFALSSTSGKTLPPIEGEPPGGAPKGTPGTIASQSNTAAVLTTPSRSPRYLLVLISATTGQLLGIM